MNGNPRADGAAGGGCPHGETELGLLAALTPGADGLAGGDLLHGLICAAVPLERTLDIAADMPHPGAGGAAGRSGAQGAGDGPAGSGSWGAYGGITDGSAARSAVNP